MPSPTITSHARWTVLTWRSVGRWSAGTESRPWMTVEVPVPGSDSHDASPGILMPPVTRAVGVQAAQQVSGTSLEVSGTSSIAANFTGWLL